MYSPRLWARGTTTGGLAGPSDGAAGGRTRHRARRGRAAGVARRTTTRTTSSTDCTPSRSRWPFGRPGVGRHLARADPPGRAGADRPRPQPVPHVGRDVGRVGRLRRDRRRLHRDREGRRPTTSTDGAGGRHQLRRLPAAAVALRHGVGPAGRRRAARHGHGSRSAIAPTTSRPRATRPPPSATASRAAVIEYGRDDGALEEQRYVDSAYTPANDPLLVTEPGTEMRDPNAWQPLALEEQVAQNGLPIPGSVQTFIGPHWGHVDPVRPAAVDERHARSTPVRRPASATRRPTRRTSRPRSPCCATAASSTPPTACEIDAGPGARWATTRSGPTTATATTRTRRPASRTNRTSSCAATSRGRSPSTGPTGRSRRRRPGHWNVIANDVTDSPGFERRLGGTGPELDPLEWDVKMYFALNGAVHDAADRGLGPQGLLRLGPADLDDPLHGRQRTVERSRRARPTTRTASRSNPAWSR